jgi:hypothetical protein
MQTLWVTAWCIIHKLWLEIRLISSIVMQILWVTPWLVYNSQIVVRNQTDKVDCNADFVGHPMVYNSQIVVRRVSYNQKMYSCITTVYIKTVSCLIYTATCFDTFMSPSDNLQRTPCKVTHILQIAAVGNTVYNLKLM